MMASDGTVARPVTPRTDIALMSGYHSPQLDVEVRLNTNESAEAPPAAFAEELARALAGVAWHRYPDRAATLLRQRIADLHGVDPSQVFCANGSNEVLQTVLLTYGGPGRSVALWEPTYAMHGHIARVVGSEIIEGERGSDFVLDADAACELVRQRQPSVAFLCSPNNPTGTEEPAATMAAMAEACASAGTLLVADEAYGQFAATSALALLDDDVPLVVTRTYSKTWSLAALRLGYLVGPAWLVDELDKAALPYRLDAIKQLAGALALDHVGEMEARAERIVAERERIVAALRDLAVQVWPSGANFVLFRPDATDGSAGDRQRGDAIWQAMVDRSVLVRNCSSWPRLAGCLRVTVGTPAENDRFLAALGEALVTTGTSGTN
jgi:histidinol-phosphate aminotransferase